MWRLFQKNVKTYIVIGSGKYATHGRIIYNDDSAFEIEKSKEDVSGIYGGTLEKEKTIAGIPIKINTFWKYKICTWQYKDFSYSYSSSKNDTNFSKDAIP